MAADTKINNAAAVAACNAIVDLVDVGAAGTLIVYAGTVPAECATAITTQTVLLTFTLAATAFGAAYDGAPGGSADLAGVPLTAVASASGTASFFRILDDTGPDIVIIQGTCGTEEADMIMNSTSIISGTSVDLDSYTFTVSEG